MLNVILVRISSVRVISFARRPTALLVWFLTKRNTYYFVLMTLFGGKCSILGATKRRFASRRPFRTGAFLRLLPFLLHQCAFFIVLEAEREPNLSTTYGNGGSSGGLNSRDQGWKTWVDDRQHRYLVIMSTALRLNSDASVRSDCSSVRLIPMEIARTFPSQK
ncbi:hypothetical protein B0H11DRAFT_1901018 [Mycena galericulata]|nr:hypothetical protein B0H11DRAFT_1901018 [Mycena galericulata]